MAAGAPTRFLVIDDNSDSRMLLVRTLLRKFPTAVLLECQNGETAVHIARSDRLDAIVAHRTFDYDGETLIALLRKVNAEVPIVMVSGHDRSAKAAASGATAFLNYDAWLQIGNVVADVMSNPAPTARLPQPSGACAAGVQAPEMG